MTCSAAGPRPALQARMLIMPTQEASTPASAGTTPSHAATPVSSFPTRESSQPTANGARGGSSKKKKAGDDDDTDGPSVKRNKISYGRE
jgi:chromatin modification-related protein EAF6